MEKTFKNYALSVSSVLLSLVFVASVVCLMSYDLPYKRKVAVIACALLSFFTTLYLLIQIKGGKNRG